MLRAALQEAERETILAGQADDKFELPATVAGKNMSLNEAKKFNQAEAQKFCESTPEFYPSSKNIETLSQYLLDNQIQIADQSTYEFAYRRLNSLRLLEERPAPEAVPVLQTTEPVIDPAEEKRTAQERYRTEIVVTDPRTGQGYTGYQLEHVSAEEYRRLMFGEFAVPQVSDVITRA